MASAMSECKYSISSDGDCVDMKNFEILPFGGMKPVGIRTLWGFYRMLKRQNKILKKHGTRAKFEIELPL